MTEYIYRSILLLTTLCIIHSFPVGAQDDAFTLTDDGTGNLTFGDDESQGSSTGSEFAQQIDNLSITVFSDLVADPGSAVMRDVLEKNLNTRFSTTADPDGDIFIANYPWFFVRVDGCSIIITMSDRPRRFTENEVSWLYANPVLQEAFDSHQAFVHIEMIQAPYGYDLRDSYRILGKLAASYTPVPSMMPEGKFIRGFAAFNLKEVAVFHDPVIIQQLLGDNPLEIFDQKFSTQPQTGNTSNQRPQQPSGQLKSNEMLMSEAMSTSQGSFNTFRRELRRREPHWSYQVQAIIRDDEAGVVEVLWMDVLNISGPTIEGKVLDTPRHVTNVDRGQPIKIPEEDLINWMITDGTESQEGIDPSLNLIPDVK